jgi:DNA-binding protein HU-beta
MTKAELIERIARSRDLPPDVSKKCIAEILDVAFEELAGYFVRSRVTRAQTPRFSFPGFGTFTKKRRSARRGVNPRTLEPMQIDAAFTLDFRPSSELRDALNGKGRGAAKAAPAAPDTPKGSTSSSAKRRLTPRDEAAELDALIPDDAVFRDGLPAMPMQRARQAGRTSKTGTR